MSRDIIDLFSGACGGWSLGFHRAGFRTVAACEMDDWRRAVYGQNFPHARLYKDVRELTADRLRADGIHGCHVLCGSPPCQDASTANAKGRGVDGARTGLFFEFVRLARELRPVWCVAENVPGIRARGVDRVLGEMEAAGYTCWPLVVGAWHAGAPHRRNRVWVICRRNDVADPAGERRGPGWPGRPDPGGAGECQPERALFGAACRGAAAKSDGGHEPQEPQGHDGEHGQRPAQWRGQFVSAGLGAGGRDHGRAMAEGDAAVRSVAAGDPQSRCGVSADSAGDLGQSGRARRLERGPVEPGAAARLGALPAGQVAAPDPRGDGVRQQPWRRGGPDGAGAAEPADDADRHADPGAGGPGTDQAGRSGGGEPAQFPDRHADAVGRTGPDALQQRFAEAVGVSRDADETRLAERQGERGDACEERASAVGASLRAWDHWNGGAPDLGRVDARVSEALAARRGIGRACLAAYGDAVVPAITEQIARAIDAWDAREADDPAGLFG